jgi:mannose-1-phosphate guanylyltransferase/mannose-6-phosphate isomerase
MLIPVIMSGGAGTRLWPVSRQAHPKPFMHLPDGQSLLQKTLQRSLSVKNVDRIVTVTNRDYYFQTRDEYADLPGGAEKPLDYILEPAGRNTAPAIIMAAWYIREQFGDDAVMLVLAADHVIEDQASFNAAVRHAEALAAQNYLVTFGIRPTGPETGYGYIEVDGELDEPESHKVKQFVEKPDLATAESYVASGDYLWNSGMFCFRAGAIIEAMQQFAPAIYEQAETCWQASSKDTPLEMDLDAFSAMDNISIDYAVMEKADNVAVVSCGFDWSDLGAWDAVSELIDADEQGNRNSGQAMFVDSINCYVNNRDDNGGRLITLLGIENTMVIDTPDALLVANREASQDVRKIVDQLKAEEHPAFEFHQTVHRPWGTYTVLEEGKGFKIKRIVVKPGASLSLQMHHHRSEHWIVVSGTAKVVNGDKEFLVQKNESTFVPAGNRHRLSNPGVMETVMIEVQSGDYLEEDDIVRFDDIYGRGDA